NRETMNFGYFDHTTPDEDIKGTVLHEFGHLLGLLHEHLNPAGNIQWNKPFIYADCFEKQRWTPKMVDQNLFDRYSVDLSNHEYDSYSIMHYPIPKEYTLNGYSVGWNYDLSEGDKKLIQEMY